MEWFLGTLGEREITRIGHNLIGFDLPTMIKRIYINGLSIAEQINFNGKKPWEINVIDTMELWQGLSKSKTSLDLLCVSLGLKNPKRSVSGKDVKKLFAE